MNRFINICISLIWLINGLFCKLLNFVPRHEQIVNKILQDDNASFATSAIGFFEILMAIWVFFGIQPRSCAIVQILVIAAMNIIEFIFAPELLLFGRFNILFAALLILIIYLNDLRPQKRR